MDLNTELVRVFPDAVVTGRCIDCHETFTGELGVRFIAADIGPGLEIVVINTKRNEIHPLARVEINLVPIAQANTVPLPPAGSA